jgi:hypothetical protein
MNLALTVIAAGLSLALGLLVSSPATPHRVDRVVASACQEDEPCWDCRTMGNLICGDSHE